jgi:hypothetical protein
MHGRGCFLEELARKSEARMRDRVWSLLLFICLWKC